MAVAAGASEPAYNSPAFGGSFMLTFAVADHGNEATARNRARPMVQAVTPLFRFGRIATIAVSLVAIAMLAACSSTKGQRGTLTSDIDNSAGSVVNIDSLTEVVQQNPGDASAYNVRGSAYGKAGKLREAIADFDTAIKINPGFYQAYANRALVQRRMNRDDVAFNDYNQAIQINPSYAVAYVGRGNMYRQRKQFDLALADFNKAVELDATDPRAYHNRGLIYQAQGDHVKAIDDFSKAISLAPTAAEPFNARGLSYLATNDFRAALDDFNEVVKRDRNSFEGWTNEGLALEKLGERQKAFAAFAHAANLNPNYGPATEGMHRNATGGGVPLSQG